MTKSFKEILLTTQKEVIELAQIRNAIHVVLQTCTEFVDEYDIDFHTKAYQYTHYLMDNDYFLQFTTAEELNDYIQKPHKYVREINLSILYENVLSKAFLQFEILNPNHRDLKFTIFRTFEKMFDNEVDYEYAIEFIDDNLLDELIDLIDDYKDEAEYLKELGYK